MRFQSGFDPPSVLLLTPWNGGLRIGSFVRSSSLMGSYLAFTNISAGVGQGSPSVSP